MQFAQFRITPVSLDVAALLVGGDSRVLQNLAKDQNNEYLLSTGAKLVWKEDEGKFGIFSYHFDGGDGWKAYFEVTGANMPCPDHGYLHTCAPCMNKYVGHEDGCPSFGEDILCGCMP